MLKQVKAMPTLSNILSNFVDDAVRDFKAQGPSYSIAEFKEVENLLNRATDPHGESLQGLHFECLHVNSCEIRTLSLRPNMVFSVAVGQPTH